MKLIKDSEFNLIKIRIGSDLYNKLKILHRRNYLSEDSYTLGLTNSYCTELAYNALKSRQPVGTDPLPLTPPKTRKAQEAHNLYQIVKTLQAKGMNTNQIVRYMNDNEYPTADDLFCGKPSINDTPREKSSNKHSRWKVADVDYLNDVEAINSLLKEMNRHRQRPKKIKRNIKT